MFLSNTDFLGKLAVFTVLPEMESISQHLSFHVSLPRQQPQLEAHARQYVSQGRPLRCCIEDVPYGKQ